MNDVKRMTINDKIFKDVIILVCLQIYKKEFILFLNLYFRNSKWRKIRSEVIQAHFNDAVVLEIALIFHFFEVWTKYLEMR